MLWLDLDSWDGKAVQEWMTELLNDGLFGSMEIVALKQSTDESWPAYGVRLVVDISELMAKPMAQELFRVSIERAAQFVPSMREIIVIDPPKANATTGALEMIAQTMRPEGSCWCYAADDDLRAYVFQQAVRTGTSWAVRRACG
jgi:hypothetical protein